MLHIKRYGILNAYHCISFGWEAFEHEGKHWILCFLWLLCCHRFVGGADYYGVSLKCCGCVEMHIGCGSSILDSLLLLADETIVDGLSILSQYFLVSGNCRLESIIEATGVSDCREVGQITVAHKNAMVATVGLCGDRMRGRCFVSKKISGKKSRELD